MFAVTQFIQLIFLILSILAVDGSQEPKISAFMAFIMVAMAILRGIYMNACVLANQLLSFVSVSINSLIVTKAAPPWLVFNTLLDMQHKVSDCLLQSSDVNSPLITAPEPNTLPPFPRIRRVGFSNEVRLRKFNPSSPPDGRPRTRAEYLLDARAKARAAEAKTSSKYHTTPRVTDFPAVRRVTFSSCVRVQEYHPGAAPKRIQADRHRAGSVYMVASGKISFFDRF
ncbi:hypothetical protein FRC03_004473 [Tulasnella sp. 419]|nr:hypothetical protein FRC03_004473 [Tulasnella sp. 419]